jgi:hypothetical protein
MIAMRDADVVMLCFNNKASRCQRACGSKEAHLSLVGDSVGD